MSKQRIILLINAVLAFLGGIVSAYLIYLHYRGTAESFCNINDYLNCDIVNKSSYAVFLGIPVAILGFAAYLTLFIASLAAFYGRLVAKIIPLMTLFSVCGLFFSFYLTYIEFFVLYALCIFCLAQQILILLITFFYLYLWIQKRKSL